MGIVIMFILSCILYKVLVSIHLARLNWKLAELQQFSGVVAVISGTVLNLILIIIMGCIYELMAFKLTHWGKCLMYFQGGKFGLGLVTLFALVVDV